MTSTVTYSLAKSEHGGESLAVSGTTVRVITSSNPRFVEVKSYLLSTPVQSLDFDHILSLIDSAPAAVSKMVQLSERVSFKDNDLYFDGDIVETALSKHLVDMIHSGDDNYPAYVAFLENLAQNPSKKSRKALFEWINTRDFTITEQGEFIAYKGVDSDGRSVHSGGAYVDGQWVNGKVPNKVGTVISMARSAVNADREVGCSTGLHAGTLSYARGFATRLLTVSINPRDVVMVPKDCDSQKLRVSRYAVIDNATAEHTETTYGGQRRHSDLPVIEHRNCEDCGGSTPVHSLSSVDGLDLCKDCTYYGNDYCQDCQTSYEYCDC
jgi:hypothetical protein